MIKYHKKDIKNRKAASENKILETSSSSSGATWFEITKDHGI